MTGNFRPRPADYRTMNCENCREAVSAGLDGENEPADSQQVDAHLRTCAACRAWQRDAARLSRAIRVRPALPTPDLTARILAAADAASSPRRAPNGETWRWLLGLVAFVQVTLGLSELLGVSHTGHAAGDAEHLFNESTAWNIALGIGFAVSAVWPRLAGGLLPTLGVFLAVLTAVSVVDLVDGNVALARVSTHVLVVLGMALLLVVHRQAAREPGPAQRRGRPDLDLPVGQQEIPEQRSAAPTTGRRHGLRPAGRRAA